MSTALQLIDVVKEFPGSPPVRALDGVDLTVFDRELLAIVGPSGSGKSTLLNIIGTLDRPTSGSVLVGATDTAGLNDRSLSAVRAHSIGFVFQQFHLMPGVSALDNVANGLVYTGTRLGPRRRLAAEALDRVGLGHRHGHRPHQLSGGERQRVAIARALVGTPRIVLADEPTGALDTRNSDAIRDLLIDLNRGGTTIVVITHDRDLAASFPRQVSFRDGRIEADEAVDTPSSRAS